jgi:hypothetical protein
MRKEATALIRYENWIELTNQFRSGKQCRMVYLLTFIRESLETVVIIDPTQITLLCILLLDTAHESINAQTFKFNTICVFSHPP